MNRFVHEQNIGNFIERLRVEHNPATRRTLQQLLIEEADKFGRRSEQIDLLDRLIADGEGHLAKLAAMPEQSHAHSELWWRLMQNVRETTDLLRRRRRRAEEERNKDTGV